MQPALPAAKSIPLVEIAKIIPPRLSNVLPRPRLLKQLEHHRDKKLILIVGQAAQGKSTLAAAYVAGQSWPSAWINLGPEDSDPANLFYLTAQALQRVLSGVDLAPILIYPTMTTGPREEAPLFREWGRALFSLLPEPSLLVFDGLDRLRPEAPAHRFLQILVEEAPSHLHLCMLSRELPPLEIQTMRIKQEAFVLANEDLAFTLWETRNFLKKVRGLLLSAEAVKHIHELTEGWVGGLVLLAEALERLPKKQREQYCLEVLAGKFAGEVFYFFGEWAYSSHPVEVQDFLLKSSLLDTLEPEMLRDFTGSGKARDILEDLSRRNLFVLAVFDRKKGWCYRYHQLFRDFLQDKVKRRWNREQQSAAYVQAASLYEQEGDLEEAVEYYLRGQDFAQAVRVMARIGPDLVKTARLGDLTRWLQALPPEIVQGNPWLLFYRFITQRYSGSREASQVLEKAYRLFAEAGEMRGCLLAVAHLLEVSVIGGRLSAPILSLTAQAENLLHAPAAEPYAYERAMLMAQLGFAHFMRTGECRKGYLACRDAHVLARSLGDIPLQFNALIHAHVNLTAMGEFSEALQVIHKVDALLEKYPYPGSQAMHVLHLGFHYLMRGDLKEAEDKIRKAQELTEQYGLANLSVVVLMHSLLLQCSLGNYREAAAMGQHLLDLTRAMGNRFFQGIIATALSMSFYHAGDYPQARKMLEQAQETLSSQEGLSLIYLRFIKFLSAMISYHCRDQEANEAELQEVLNEFQAVPMPYFSMIVHLILALLQGQRGRAQEAAGHLAQGFHIAREKGFYHHLFVARPDLARACGLALELEVTEAMDYAAHLLTTRLADVAGPELERLARHLSPKVARKAQELQRTVHRARLPRLRLKTLGEFQVLRGKVPIPAGEWEGQQPRLLLKALVAHNPAGASREALMEALWPEESPARAEKNFKVNLHRLRKAQEPTLNKDFGSSYVYFQDNLVVLDPELCQVDAEAFRACCREAEQQEKAGKIKEALDRYQEAVALYGGDFLTGDLYASWAADKRDELRRQLLDTLLRLAALHERQGSLRAALECCQRVIQTDPLLEEAYQQLMLLNARLGRRSAALRAYADCQAALKRELNVDPDEVTQAIYRKILGSRTSPYQDK